MSSILNRLWVRLALTFISIFMASVFLPGVALLTAGSLGWIEFSQPAQSEEFATQEDLDEADFEEYEWAFFLIISDKNNMFSTYFKNTPSSRYGSASFFSLNSWTVYIFQNMHYIFPNNYHLIRDASYQQSARQN